MLSAVIGFCSGGTRKTKSSVMATLLAEESSGAGCQARSDGRGSVGDQHTCIDGPVFRYDQIQRFLEAF